jgi:hypothetical protein
MTNIDQNQAINSGVYQKKFVLQPLFCQKDVAKFGEARKVTRSLQIESNSLHDVGHQRSCVQSIFDDW